MISLYVTHHVTAELDGINDILIDQLWRMRDVTAAPIFVACWTNEDRYLADIHSRLPPDVDVLVNDRPGRPDTQPSLRNLVVEHARASASCEAFVLLHNDVRLSRGCLRNLVRDWRHAEQKWGRHSSIVSPRFIPYHLTTPELEAVSDDSFWAQLAANPNVKSATEMAAWCRQWGFGFEQAYRPHVIGEVVAPDISETTDDGHQLMMFIASPRFFDDVGPCDEAYVGVNYDDCEWGMRALVAGKKNLQSTGALVGHIAGLSFKLAHGANGERREAWRIPGDNAQIFIAKYGRALFDEMQTGDLWTRLHREQLGTPAQ